MYTTSTTTAYAIPMMEAIVKWWDQRDIVHVACRQIIAAPLLANKQ